MSDAAELIERVRDLRDHLPEFGFVIPGRRVIDLAALADLAEQQQAEIERLTKAVHTSADNLSGVSVLYSAKLARVEALADEWEKTESWSFTLGDNVPWLTELRAVLAGDR